MSDDLNFTVQRPPAYGELTDVLPACSGAASGATPPNHVNAGCSTTAPVGRWSTAA